MDEFARTLNTGDVMVFDKKTRTLYLIDAAHVRQGSQHTVASAQALVASGQAKVFDRAALEKLQAAMAGIVLLEAQVSRKGGGAP